MDGGGTKTHCILTDLNGKIIHECTGDASNFLVKGVDPVCQTLFDLITEITHNSNIKYSDLAAVMLGTTGAGRRRDAEALETAFKNFCATKGVKINRFYVDSDARIALEGAFSGKPGSILIAGTGSIMFGKDAKGNIHRVGGFGRFLGDEGSGFVIGKKGLTAVSKYFDGRGSNTLITSLVKERFNIASSEELITEIYKNNFDIASAAPIVIEAAEKGDDIALKLIDEETNELILHIKAMDKKINEQVLKVSFIGGIISTDNFYSRTFRKKISRQLPNVVLKEPDYPPAMGAILMAKDLLNKK
jgi:N-acetylglucosamine kinase-like BadF-type ATPase